MKLLTVFQNQLEQMGELKHVWLTSFNFSPEFVETYLLSAVLGMDVPRNRLDYEHMQLSLTEKKIDFRVFCDKRFIEVGQNKRTAMPVHGISPVRMEWFSKESLFHPKVIYLEDVNGKKMLGSGSANLTVSGWGRNQEVFQFFEVTTLEQYRSVREFFKNLFENVGLESPLGIRRSFKEAKSHWKFVHSFQESTFLEQFFDGCESDCLMVWSPYLPRDLAAYIGKLRSYTGLEDLKVYLVPDRVDGKYIRTQWSDALKTMVAKEEVTFCEPPSPQHENVEMCHAKVWKLSDKLAIGSWNFTGPGSNALLDDRGNWSLSNNIEAGFVINDQHRWDEAIGKPIELNEQDFASTDLLNEEELEVPKDLPFDIRIHFNWQEQCYGFEGEWFEGAVDESYWLKLPDITQSIQICWRPRKKTLQMESQIVKRPDALLSEHRYEIIHKGKVVYRGLITESGLIYRRSQAYESLRDLIDAFVFGSDDGADTPYAFRIPGNENLDFIEDGFDDEPQYSAPSTEANISYFRLFQATNEYAQKIDAVKNMAELNQRVFSRPGCLVELVEKTSEKLKESEPTVFNWFLAQEVNALCKLAKKRYRSRSLVRNSDLLPKSRWDELIVSTPALPKGVQREYVELVRQECGYVSK